MGERFALGEFEVDAEGLLVLKGSKRLRLEAKSMSVLCYLRARSPEVVSVRELLTAVWGDASVGDNVVHRAVALLRKALGGQGRDSRFIETVPGRGYRLVEPSPGREMPTLAVLPFQCVTEDGRDDAFALGLTHEIWNQMTRLPEIRVVSLTSSRRLRGRSGDARAIGTELGARHLVEGSLQRDGSVFRVHVALVDAQSGACVASRGYERAVVEEIGALFALYDEIASDVRNWLARALRRDFPESLATRVPTRSVAAYRLHLEGLHAFSALGHATRALERLDAALAIDPDYYDARMLRASILLYRTDMNLVAKPAHVGYREAREALRPLLLERPEDGRGWILLGRLHANLDLDFSQALAAYERAEQLGAARPRVLLEKAGLWINTGAYNDAEAALREAERLEPVNIGIKDWLARALHFQGDFDASDAKFDEALLLGPKNRFSFRTAFCFARYRGDLDRMLVLREHGARYPVVVEAFVDPMISAMQGDPEPLRALVRQFEGQRTTHHVATPFLTQLCWWLPDIEGHLRWFDVREQEQDSLMWTRYELALLPRYWRTIEGWARADRRDRARRATLLAEHRARIARIIHKMAL